MRKATAADEARFRESLAYDQDHAGQDADKWLAEPGEFMVFYDEIGHRVFVRIEKCLRIHIQPELDVKKRDLIPILLAGLRWVMGQSREQRYTEILYESKTPKLISFFGKLFGFKPVENTFKVVL